MFPTKLHGVFPIIISNVDNDFDFLSLDVYHCIFQNDIIREAHDIHLLQITCIQV